MTREQKAKAYDKAVKEASIAYKDEDKHLKATLERIFPELKESEDEKSKKWILEYLHDGLRKSDEQFKDYFKAAIAWLEKQGKHLENYDEAEKEKADFVGDGFIKCHADFLDFKEGNTYWLEYIGDDKYNVRSDNLLGKTYHITPGQLYTVFKKSTWLGKRGEKKSANKVEPEFHEGEWVVYNHDICQIVKREEGCNKLVTVFGIEKELVNERNLSTAHLWTIQDAKDGDVLACNGEILLFKSYSVQDRISLYCWYNEQTNNFHNKEVVDVLLTTRNKVCPATKEQRDLLFQKMAEAGYEWNASKKELKKIEDKPENYKQQLMSEITNLVEDYISQKPTWSEEDEKKLSDIISILGGGENCFYNSPILIDWLKSLKERIGG